MNKELESAGGKSGCCDVCDTPLGDDCSGSLQGHWGAGSSHVGERYSVRLCESCFFSVLADLRRQRMVNRLFEDDPPEDGGEFGLVRRGAQ